MPDAEKSGWRSARHVEHQPTSQAPASVVELSIEDSGPGVPTGNAKQILEPLFRTKAAGMGMGLSIARTIIESHRGQLWAHNQSGGGAVFRFT